MNNTLRQFYSFYLRLMPCRTQTQTQDFMPLNCSEYILQKNLLQYLDAAFTVNEAFTV